MKKFLILLKYKKSIDEIEKHLNAHIAFLDKYYNSNNFIFSGRKNPRTGGVILSKFNSIEEVNAAIKQDPFFMNELADYEVIEFEPTRGMNF